MTSWVQNQRTNGYLFTYMTTILSGDFAQMNDNRRISFENFFMDNRFVNR